MPELCECRKTDYCNLVLELTAFKSLTQTKKNQALNINWPPYPGKVKCSLQECLFSSSSHRHSVASTLLRETWEEEETLMPIGVI